MQLDVKQIETDAERLIEPVLGNLGYGLVACEFLQDSGRWVLRIYIDKEGGVTIDDCVRASHGVEDLIAVEDFIPVGYSLEVSSPGINRPLRRREDFERSVGERVSIKTEEPIDGRKNFKGMLKGLKGDEIVMEIDGSEYRLPMEAARRAHLHPLDVQKKKKKVH